MSAWGPPRGTVYLESLRARSRTRFGGRVKQHAYGPLAQIAPRTAVVKGWD